jgi:CRISPR/Cas system CMR subunit Cmr4 (Cas7 group RAMP superfamily)
MMDKGAVLEKMAEESARGYREDERRDVIARWTVTAQLTLLSAAQIGSHESDYCDQSFARNEDGRPILLGSTMAGALRNALSDRRAGYRADEPGCTGELFGDETRHESPVIVFDSTALELVKTSIRDGVCLKPGTGTARDKGKYDRELSLPGVVFPIRLDVVVMRSLNEEALLRDLADALDGLTDDSIRFGARKSRGLGRCKADLFRALRYDLTDKEGWKKYADSLYTLQALTGEDHITAEKALAAGWKPLPDASDDDQRKALLLQFNLDVDGTLLIRSPGVEADDPDMIHLTEDGKAVLSGTALAGALRSHVLRILNTLRDLGMLTNMNAALNLSDLFGPRPEEIESGMAPSASRVEVMECVKIAEAASYRQSRIKIDRFTGGALDKALFEEQPSVGGTVAFTVKVKNPTDAEIGLLALASRDLAAGLVPVGGEAAVGRGILRGKEEGIIGKLPDGREFRSLMDLQPYVEALTSPKERPQAPIEEQN